MAIKKVFTDADSNELEMYINKDGELFISVGKPGDEVYYKGFICLDKTDVMYMIKELKSLLSEM
jgi:hypothetical protein